MKAGKFLDEQECWHQAATLSLKIQTFNAQVQDKIRILNSKEWEELNPERNTNSPYQTEGSKKFSGACFWFLFAMVYERHLSYNEWAQLFEYLETQLLTAPATRAITMVENLKTSQLLTGKHPSKRAKSLSRRFEVQSMRSVSNTHERQTYTISDDIGLLQLRIRVSKLQAVSKLEPETDIAVPSTRKNSQIEEGRSEHPSSKKSTSQPITNFYPVIKTENKQEANFGLSPIKSEPLSLKCSPRPSSRKVSVVLGAPLSSAQKSVSIDELIAEFAKEHQEVQSSIKNQLSTIKKKVHAEHNENIGQYMTLDNDDFETQNRAALVGKWPGPIGLIFQNCYRHISCDDEKIFRALRDLTLKANKKKSKMHFGTISSDQQEGGGQWIVQKAGNPGSSRTIRDSGMQVSKFKGSHSSPQAVQGLASNTLPPRSNMMLEDDKCQVCGDGDYTDTNLIVYCAKCNICVHQLCYGLESLPKGNWICDLCRYYGYDGSGMRCPLCPRVGGIMRRCNIQSTDSSWSKFSPEYFNYMKSGPHDSTEEPPQLISPDILSFERMAIKGDYKAHLSYDYFGCLTMGLKPPASPRPYLAWLHVCCLPSYTDLRPYTNGIGSHLQSEGHLTTPIQLPEIFPTNHKVPWLFREIHPTATDSSTSNTPQEAGQKIYLVPYDKLMLPPNLSADHPTQRSKVHQSRSTSLKNNKTGPKTDFMSTKSRIEREKSRASTPDESKKVLQSPARKIFVQSPPPASSRIMKSRDRRTRSRGGKPAEPQPAINLPQLNTLSQIKAAAEDYDHTTLEAYRPEWTSEDQRKFFLSIAQSQSLTTAKQKELLRDYVLPCSCCSLSSGFLFSCPKCNQATHGSCGVVAGARRIGDRITCKEHTEDGIFTLLKACQDKNKNEILAWLELDEQCVPIEKAMREIKLISKQIKEIRSKHDEGPLMNPNERTIQRNLRNKKQQLQDPPQKKEIKQLVITICKKSAKRFAQSLIDHQYSTGITKATEYFLSDGLVKTENRSTSSIGTTPAYSKTGLPKSIQSSSRSQTIRGNDSLGTEARFGAHSNDHGNTVLDKTASPLSFSEIAEKKTGIVESTRFRLTKDHLNLSLEEIPTELQTPPRLGLLVECKQEQINNYFVPEPDYHESRNSLIGTGQKALKIEPIAPHVPTQGSLQQHLVDNTSCLIKSEGEIKLPKEKECSVEEPPKLGLPISTEVKLKIEETLKLVVEPPSEHSKPRSEYIPESKTLNLSKPCPETVLSVALSASWQFYPGNASIKLELMENSRLAHRILFKSAYPKANPSQHSNMKIKLFGPPHKDSPLLFIICAKPLRIKSKPKITKPADPAVKEPDPEINPHMLGRRTILIPKVAHALESAKVEEEQVVPIKFSSLYKTEPQVIPDSSIRSLHRIPLVLGVQATMGTPPKMTLSLAENREPLRSNKDWEGLFNTYLKDKRSLSQKRSQVISQDAPGSKRIVSSAKFGSQKPRPYNFKRSPSRPRRGSLKPEAN